MSKDFILPDIGEGIVECEVAMWYVKEGDTVVEDQPVCDVITDKAMVQIPAVSDGTVTKLYHQQGEMARVHAPLFALASEGESTSEATPLQSVTSQVMDQAPVVPINSKATVTEDFLLPDIGEGIVECEIVAWLVEEGDNVIEDQLICEVMTDKAVVEIPAKSDGTVSKLYYNKGDIATVHQPLFAITSKVQDGQSSNHTVAPANNQVQEPRQSENNNIQSTMVDPSASERSNNKQLGANGSATVSANKPVNVIKNAKAVASPAVRRLAREMNIDIRTVVGSGVKGRVYKKDLVAYDANHSGNLTTSSSQASQQDQSVADNAANNGQRTESIKGIKAAMAKAMVESVNTIPHFTYSDEIDLTELVKLRQNLKTKFAKEDIKLTMMPFFIKAMSLALKSFPILNSQPNADCTELTYFDDHNIGMAVDSKVGLLVPNIKQCQNKSIRQIAVEVMSITENARAGRLSPQELKGGSISISNIGAIGGTTATPIINKPEVAIVALGKMQELPRFDSEQNVVSRRIMTVSWSGDHRIIDGGTIARFNNLWTSYLEDPSSMLTELV